MEPRIHRRNRLPLARGLRVEGSAGGQDSSTEVGTGLRTVRAEFPPRFPVGPEVRPYLGGGKAATVGTPPLHVGRIAVGGVLAPLIAAVVLTCGPFEAAAQTAQAPQTVNEAVFRSRWVGPQADRVVQQSQAWASNRDIEPVEELATKLRKGLYWGSLRFRPGLGLGWEFSNRNTGGQETDGANDSSFFVAPSLGLSYDREFGPLAVSLLYGGGYVYYVNPDYTSAQSGNQRNPLNQTVRMKLQHVGTRHEGNFIAGLTYGDGENIQVGGNTTTTTVDVGGDFTYLLTEFFSLVNYAGFNSQFTRYGNNNDNGSDLYSARGGTSLDWLATGKTTLGLNLEAGFSVQEILTPAPAAPPPVVAVAPVGTNGVAPVLAPAPAPAQATREQTISREYVQLLATGAQSVTSKLLVTGGLGAGYVTDDSVPDAEYVGIRPVYQFSATYTPSEKTQVRLTSNFEGVQLVPSVSLGASWNPRETTSFSWSIYQNQNFSITTTSQFQVNRGFVASATQKLFSRITVTLSGGWQQTENRGLSSNDTVITDSDYTFVSGGLRWDFNDWLSWQTTIWASTGNQTSGGGNDYPETTASTGLNLIF